MPRNDAVLLKPRDVEAANAAGVKGILIEPDEQIDYDKVIRHLYDRRDL